MNVPSFLRQIQLPQEDALSTSIRPYEQAEQCHMSHFGIYPRTGSSCVIAPAEIEAEAVTLEGVDIALVA